MNPIAETREKVKALTDRLEAGVKEVFESEQYKAYLKAMSKFHQYSFGNVMLILMQCPEASLVADFQTWKKQFGRTVKKGEHGIQIIAPMQRSRLVKQDRLDPDTQQPIIGPDGVPEKEPVFVNYPSFRVAYVFDVSQTEGKELPSYGVDELTGDVPYFDSMFSAIEHVSPVPVEYRPATDAKGGYNHLEQKIYVNEGMSQVQTIKTLIHETAHAKLHALPVENGKIVGKPDKDQCTREVEAESIAYVVCQHFGIDTSDYSFPYVTGWSRGKELNELKASLDCISKTAAEIIDGIEKHCPEIARGLMAQDERKRFTGGLLTKSNFKGNDSTEGKKKDTYQRQVKAQIILLRFKAVAERRQWSPAASKPRRKTRVKLWHLFWIAEVPSHQICRSFSACL